jgi:electron transfer flavoprotein alpha subunit
MSTPARSGSSPPAECWVWLPRDRDGALHPSASELLFEASALSRRLNAALVCWSDRPPDSEELHTLGAWQVRQVRALDRPLDPHPVCIGGNVPIPGEHLPRAFLFSDDATGRVLAPLWAAQTGAAYVPGATSLTSDGANFVVARPTLGDQFEALVSVDLSESLVITLTPGSVGSVAPPHLPPASLPVVAPVRTGAALPPPSREFPPDPATLDVADAERIVAFGRGAFAPEAIALVRELAALLGAAVAGSRPAADEGWLPFARQVGLTGAIVRPKLYIAVGISGAPYHMAGVKDPETLIAINRDPEAPIFGAAHLGIVGDLYQVLPALIEQLRRGHAPAALQAAQSAAMNARRP